MGARMLTVRVRFVAPNTGTGERYAVEMGGLWSGLSRTLARLEGVAADPERLDEVTAADALRRLQYALHLAAEHAYGIVPPPSSASAHAELADALTCARELTAEVAEAVELWGADGVQPLLHEWRGALFRVRLARMRLASAPPAAPPPQPRDDERFGPPLLAFCLSLGGALALVTGATLGVWPVWVAGVLAVCGSLLAYRP
jgi:hypothetical protein